MAPYSCETGARAREHQSRSIWNEKRVDYVPDSPQQCGHTGCHQLAYSPDRAAQSLHDNGYAIIPIAWMNDVTTAYITWALNNDMKKFQEFVPGAKTYVMGGFSALGNPSSFHNMSVRTLRMCAMSELLPLFKSYVNNHLATAVAPAGMWKLEQVVDRILFREAGVSPSPESWHRDKAINLKPHDAVFGGWWNLNDFDQHLSCVPGSHILSAGTPGTSATGFVTVDSKEEKEACKSASRRIVVPPRSIVVFHEDILHEVVPTKMKVPMLRLFLGWRLTLSSDPLIPDLASKLEDQAVMPLKSGQIPPMYAKLHWTNWRTKIVDFTHTNIVDACKTEREVMSGKDKGQTLTVVQQHMKSLKDYGLALYPTYTEIEYRILTPQEHWVNMPCGCGSTIDAKLA